MTRENALLRHVFPDTYWQGEDAIEYYFVENYKRISDLLHAYLFEEIKEDDKVIEMKERHQDILKMLSGLGADKVEFAEPEEGAYRVQFAHEILAFFNLGIRKQVEGKKPKVEISW